jgi:salicylate hydroxylase
VISAFGDLFICYKKHGVLSQAEKNMTSNLPSHNPLHIGLCGGGLGGLATAIALRRAGAQVTVLEAASELGEIGAGIQMTPNVSRLLMKWGVSDIIGENLVEVEELNLRRRNGVVSVVGNR